MAESVTSVPIAAVDADRAVVRVGVLAVMVIGSLVQALEEGVVGVTGIGRLPEVAAGGEELTGADRVPPHRSPSPPAAGR